MVLISDTLTEDEGNIFIWASAKAKAKANAKANAKAKAKANLTQKSCKLAGTPPFALL